MNPVTDNLIHFLGRRYKDSPDRQFGIFESIISSGLLVNSVVIPFSFSGVLHGKAVCFTDIPLNLLTEHVTIYGKFGIGFKKSFIKKVGGNPVRYFVDYNPHHRNDEKAVEIRGIMYHNLSTIFALFKEMTNRISSGPDYSLYNKDGTVALSGQQIQEICNQFVALYSFEKETGDLGPARDDDPSTDSYYREREWRIVPVEGNVINHSIVDRGDNKMYIPFERSDINMIVVPNSDIKRKIINKFSEWNSGENASLKQYYIDQPTIIVYDEIRNW